MTNKTAFERIEQGFGARVFFKAVSDDPLTETQARELQEPDYPPMGYGFYNFKCVQISNGRYLSTWNCGSCE